MPIDPFPAFTGSSISIGAGRRYQLSIERRAAQQSSSDSSTNSSALDPDLLVEGFIASDALHGIRCCDILIQCAERAAPRALDPAALIGRNAALHFKLAGSADASHSGLINQLQWLDSDGGRVRARLRLVSWLWLTTQQRNNRVWQQRPLDVIIDSVFAGYRAHAAWRWSSDAFIKLAELTPLDYCVQYDESDYSFVARLLAEHGFSWRTENTDDAPCGHQLVLFADSSQTSACPRQDALRFDPAGSAGAFDLGQARSAGRVTTLGSHRILQAASTTVLSNDYQIQSALAASVDQLAAPTHPLAPQLESYDTPGANAWPDRAAAEQRARQQQQAREARGQLWQLSANSPTLGAGKRLTLSNAPALAMRATPGSNSQPIERGDADFTLLAVVTIGINNLPASAATQNDLNLTQPAREPVIAVLERLLQRLPSSMTGGIATHSQLPDLQIRLDRRQRQALLAQAESGGIVHQAIAIGASCIWHPILADDTGLRSHPRATINGSHSATVIGLNDESAPIEANELCCDRLGRIRIRFHWQGRHADQAASCWVRVAQRAAGNGIGAQFLPRIGQEVSVQFLESNAARPIVVGTLYNGCGEGGVMPTPGGQPAAGLLAPGNHNPFAIANDQLASGQANLAGGHSPVWHGAAPGNNAEGQRNAAAQFGIRSKEFGGRGYNQLLFDDSTGQGRVQLKTTQAATELNLGHLIHTADNYRGSLRGQGIELRSDAFGALRAGAGLLISSFGLPALDQLERTPAGDNTQGLAHIRQALELAKKWSALASTHQGMPLAVVQAQGADGSSPLADLRHSMNGVTEQGLPHSATPLLTIAAKAGLGLCAGADLQWVNGATTSFMTGRDAQISGQQGLQLHSDQAIGIVAGVAGGISNQFGIGLQLIAAQQPIQIEAHSDQLTVQAQQDVEIKSAHGELDFAAAKRIHMSTAAGAHITMEGGNLLVQCPGRLTVKAGVKRFEGPAQHAYHFFDLPQKTESTEKVAQFVVLQDQAGYLLKNRPYRIWMRDGKVFEGISDKNGTTQTLSADAERIAEIELLKRRS